MNSKFRAASRRLAEHRMCACKGEGWGVVGGVEYGLGPVTTFWMLVHGRPWGGTHKPWKPWEVRVMQWDGLVEIWVPLL